MAHDALARLTLTRILFGDMILNWLLGGVLMLAPAAVDRALGSAPLLPAPAYRLIGGAFLLFAAWQASLIRRGEAGRAAWLFAGLMCVIPFALLAVALLFLPFALRPAWRIVLWAGNTYMLLLGIWYLTLAAWRE